MKTGVYCIRNTVNGKRYVGMAARSLKGRWKDHLKRLRGGYHYNHYLRRAWDKYGSEAFVFEVLEYCPPELCVEREQFFMDKYQSYKKRFGYNEAPTAGSQLGMKHGPETRKKISEKRMANPPTLTEAALEAIGNATKDYWADPEHRAMRVKALQEAAKRPGLQEGKSAKMKGHKVSAETRAKMSASALGKVISKEQRAKASLAAKAQWERDRERLTALNRANSAKPEVRARISASRKGQAPWNKGKKMTAAQKAAWEKRRLQKLEAANAL